MDTAPSSCRAQARARTAARLGALVALAAALTLVGVVPAVAHDDDDDHGHSHDDENGHSHADAVVWGGEGSDREDCDALDPGRIRWEFDPGTDHDLTYAELHIDEPEANVWPLDGPPFVWETPYYDLELIEADADGFDGTPGDDAELAIVAFCPPGLAHTGVPVALLGLFGGAALAGGAALVRRR